jgi:hypothetical protein
MKSIIFLYIILFLLISFVAPYASAKGETLVFSPNPEECSKSVEKDFFDDLSSIKIKPFEYEKILILTLEFPIYLALKPQNFPDDFLRPPRFILN